MDDRKTAHDATSAERAAQRADDDAAVLDADLAHMEADEPAQSGSSS